MMSGTNSAEKLDVLGKIAASASMSTETETRKDDPDWFEGKFCL